MADTIYGADITREVEDKMVQEMFPGTPAINIAANLPLVLRELSAAGLGDHDMVVMALASIRVESASFQPLSEGVSRFNTSPGSHSFNRYDFRTDLGNHGSGMGAQYRGRGYAQLTGGENYRRIGDKIGVDLYTQPERANEPGTASRVLAAFLKDHEARIRSALANGDLPEARRLYNGGSHGLDDFTEAFRIGDEQIPGESLWHGEAT